MSCQADACVSGGSGPRCRRADSSPPLLPTAAGLFPAACLPPLAFSTPHENGRQLDSLAAAQKVTDGKVAGVGSKVADVGDNMAKGFKVRSSCLSSFFLR